MRFTKQCQITKWTNWHHTLAKAIADFVAEFSLSPNIIQATEHTFSQFDFLVNIDPIHKNKVVKIDDSYIAGEDEPVKLAGFNLADFTHKLLAELDFAVGNHLKDKEFLLVYDDEAEWDGNKNIIDVPEEEFELVWSELSYTEKSW
jgi:hypothetical protein